MHLELSVLVMATVYTLCHSKNMSRVPLVKQDFVRESINTNYAGLITTLNPSQRFLVVFDTSSSNMVLPSTSCLIGACKCTYISKYFSYNEEDASREEEVTTTILDHYQATGPVEYTSLNVSTLAVKGQGFILANILDFILCAKQTDGVVGLKPPGSSPLFKHSSVFQNLVAQNNMPAVLSMYHTSLEDGASVGEIIFGGSDPTYYKGEITYVPLSNDHSWQFKLDGVRVNEENVVPDGTLAFFDTSKNVIGGPRNLIREINKNIGCTYKKTSGTEVCEVDCSKIDSLPQVSFVIGGKEFNITSNLYIKKQTRFLCFSLFHETESEVFQLGDTFMESYYTVFDWEKKVIGVAVSSHVPLVDNSDSSTQ